MPSKPVDRAGFWSTLVLALLGVVYIAILAGTMLSGVGFSPPEPYQTLLLTGISSLSSALGQVINSAALSLAGAVGWGPGLTVAAALLAIWFRKRPSVGPSIGERYPTPPGNV